MHILMLNWKDTSHSLAGGAERVTHDYLKELVRLEHSVTLFTSHEAGLLRRETVDGIKVIRYGNLYTVRLWAPYYYLTRLRGQTDIVIDQIHGIPFFTPLYVTKPIVAFIHEVAGNIWFKEFFWPVAVLGFLWEKSYFFLYKGVRFITDALSTKKELVTNGVKSHLINVIPLTILPVKRKKVPKSSHPLLVYIGRLSPTKRLDMFINAVKILIHDQPNCEVIICGQGTKKYVDTLKKLIQKTKLKNINYFGPITEAKKYTLFAKAWIHVQPSIKEGFGLTVLEAASQETPTIAFDVNGLKDIIIHNKTGLLVKKQTSEALAEQLNVLLKQKVRLKQLSKNSYKWFTTLPSVSTQSKLFEKTLVTVVDESK